MTAWKRNTNGLQRAAQQKAERTKQRAEETIARFIRERRPITFKGVAQAAQISTAWLYANEDIKERIIHLRSQQAPNASKERMIAALQKRVEEQAAEIRELKRQLEVVYGQLTKQ